MRVVFDIDIKVCENCPHHRYSPDYYTTHCEHEDTPGHIGSWSYGKEPPAWCPLKPDREPFPEKEHYSARQKAEQDGGD